MHVSKLTRLAALAAALAATAACSREPDAAPAGHAGHGGQAPVKGQESTAPRELASKDAAGALPGYAQVELTAERIQKFGVRTQIVSRVALTRSVRTVGVVRTDETRESEVRVKWDGWIEEFFVSFVGQKVKKGDPLFSVYSPEVFGAQQELIGAAKRAAAGRDPGADAMLAASRGKLRHWDVPEATIAEIEKSGEIQRAITVNAPRDGTVLARAAVPGMMIDPSMALYTIADLSRVWVIVDVYEYEAPAVRIGQSARFEPAGWGARVIVGEVTFVAPTVDPTTRTVKVRLDLPNEDGSLRPGAYGTVRIEIPAPEGIAIASDAVIDTGTRTIVFVDKGEGVFEPRDVQLGARVAGQAEVLDGLKEGEAVVTRAQFLLDSESRIRGGPTGPGHSGH